MIGHVITLAPGGIGEGIVLQSVCLSVCLFVCLCVCVCVSVREHISTTNDQIYLIFSQKVGSASGSVLLEDDPNQNLDPDFMTDFMTIFGVREHI